MALERTLEQQAVEYILHPERWLRQLAIEQVELRGKRNILKQQLGVRFGALSPEVLARIDAATSEDLEAMALRVLTANTLDEALCTSTGSG